MDNLTHTLIGGAYFSLLPKRLRTKPALVAATVGSNLPDLDVLMRAIPGQTHFDYLVHHRGYTHTILLAAPFAFALAWILHRFMKEKIPIRTLALISLGAVFLHLFADFWNDYGVHPLSPFSNQWFYGDSIFIVEPYLWMTLIPMFVSLLQSKIGKTVCKVLFALALALIWFHDTVTLVPAIVLSMVALFWSIYFYRPRSTIPAVVFTAMVVAFFFTNSHGAREIVQAPLAEFGQVREVHSSPAPGNPFCWRVISHVKDVNDLHRITFAQVSLWSVPGCRLARATPETAAFEAFSTAIQDPRIQWLGAHSFSQASFDEIYEKSCTFRRLLSFARFPFFKPLGSNEYIAGDLRYDREVGQGFAEVKFSLPDDCGGKAPPWDAPFLSH